MPAWDGSSAEVPTGSHSSRNHSACLRVPVLRIAGPSPERGLIPRQALDKHTRKHTSKHTGKLRRKHTSKHTSPRRASQEQLPHGRSAGPPPCVGRRLKEWMRVPIPLRKKKHTSKQTSKHTSKHTSTQAHNCSTYPVYASPDERFRSHWHMQTERFSLDRVRRS